MFYSALQQHWKIYKQRSERNGGKFKVEYKIHSGVEKVIIFLDNLIIILMFNTFWIFNTFCNIFLSKKFIYFVKKKIKIQN